MGRMEGEQRSICPRCGQPYSYIEARRARSNIYYYAVHYHWEAGKRKVRKCYLGPEHYYYVTKLHKREGLTFRGLNTGGRVLSYLDTLFNYIYSPEFNLTPEVALKLAEKMERLAGRLRVYGRRKGGRGLAIEGGAYRTVEGAKRSHKEEYG